MLSRIWCACAKQAGLELGLLSFLSCALLLAQPATVTNTPETGAPTDLIQSARMFAARILHEIHADPLVGSSARDVKTSVSPAHINAEQYPLDPSMTSEDGYPN